MTDTAEQVTFPGPDEIEGFWAFDKMHAPRPLHPLSQDLVMSTLAVGFTKAQAEYDCPIVASNQAINHYFYMAFHPHPDEAVVEDRMSRYLDTLDKKVPLVGKRWTNEWLPMIRTRNESERDADYSAMSNAELLAKFDDMKSWMTEMWYIHGHINFALVSGVKLSDFYANVMHPDDPTEAYQILQGHHTRPVDAAHGLWRLSRVVRDSASLHRLFDETHPRDLAAKLAETDEGRAFLDELNEYLYDFGWRSDAVYDIADVPWRENPAIPLGNIARYINMPDEDDPMIQYERAVKHREDLTGKIRAELADKPDELAQFDEYYDAAQYAVPLTEDHAFYIDQMGVVLLRTFVLAVGDALVRDGVIDDRSDVFLLFQDEVRDALVNGGDQRATVRQRRASVEAAAQASPPGALGTPPPPAGRFRRSVHGCHRHPPARHQAAGGRRAGPQRDRRGGRVAGHLPWRRPRREVTRRGRRSGRRRDHGVRDDTSAVGPDVLHRRRGRLRCRRRDEPLRHRRSRVQHPRCGRHR